jgi:anti-sigma factor RsiW
LAYADGELTAREAGLVAAHLETCPSCRAEFEALIVGQARLEATFADEPSAAESRSTPGPSLDFTARVMNEIRRQEAGISRSKEARLAQSQAGRAAASTWIAWARPLAAASMVATLLLGTYTALTMDARSYARIIAYQQRTVVGIRDDFWTVARKTGLDGIITRYLSQIDSTGR